MPTYLVKASSKGVVCSWSIEAPLSSKAVRAAREAARAEGLGRIMVRSVERVDVSPLPACHTDLPLSESNDDDLGRFDELIAAIIMQDCGPALSVDELNAAIEDIVGTDAPLRAVERDGHIFLDDGVNHTVVGDNLSRHELVILCYEMVSVCWRHLRILERIPGLVGYILERGNALPKKRRAQATSMHPISCGSSPCDDFSSATDAMM